MNPDMLESADQREKIRRLIFEPLEGRGEPPRGWTTEQLLADYVLALARYPETVLEAAAAKVRAARTRTTWPLAGDYQAACDELMVDEVAPDLSSKDDAGRTRRSRAAWDYVSGRFAAANHTLWFRALTAGVGDGLRRWMFDRACEQLRAGNDPVIREAEVEAEIEAILDRHAEAKAKVADQAKPVPAGNLPVRQIEDQVRAAREEEMEL